jgi:hypothetical protein
MTDDTLPPLPEPDGSAEANKEPSPDGLGYLYDEVPAWSEPLVRAYAAQAVAQERERHAADARDAARYRYLRGRLPADVFSKTGADAGCWIDCENDYGTLTLLTAEDADFEIDAAIRASKGDKP